MNPLFEKLEKMGLKTSGDPNERLPVTRADVESLEAFFGFPFPPLYAEFAGYFGKCKFDFGGEFPYCKLPDDWVERADYDEQLPISDFYGLDLDLDGNDDAGFRATVDGYRGSHAPNCFLPLFDNNGDDPMGLFLCCGEQNYDCVYALPVSYYYAIENGASQIEALKECAVLLANSFEEFLEGLELMPSQNIEQPEMEPLFAAMFAGDVSYLQNIVDAGEIATYRSKYGYSLLRCALISQLEWPIELLLNQGAPIEEASPFAMTSAIGARLFIAHGIDPNQPYFYGSGSWGNYLILAVINKKYELTRVLISAGADATLPDSYGRTAWDYLPRPRNQVMRDILKESIPVPPEERAKYILPTEPKAPL